MVIRKEMELAGRKFSAEIGRVAKQANGSAWVQFGETIVLSTVCASSEPKEGLDFFPLSVEYKEKTYAVGKIPGGFFKREARPSEHEILAARIVDRPIRPLFPENFKNEVQVIVQVLSSDGENDADVLAVTATSIALNTSNIPFEGPIAGVRVGRINGEFVVNPTNTEREFSDIDLLIAASEDSIAMVEGDGDEINEDEMLQALEFGHEAIRQQIAMQKEIIAEINPEKMPVPEGEDISELTAKIEEMISADLQVALKLVDKTERNTTLKEHTNRVLEALEEDYPEQEKTIKTIIHDIEKVIIRKSILEENRRLDGRGLDEIRPISIEIGVLPRAHGSALFTRGQTQSLSTTTLGTKVDEQMIEDLSGTFYKNYMLHYNFPPFSTGEVKPMRGTSRREVGHGNLAERSLKPILPSNGVFPYTVRIVSEILESNGSSSMATVCGGSLSLMDAGVPVKSHIAGIAMGLIKEDDKVAVLTDILGDEDHFGDMDFKVAGNRDGITGFQMDIKIKGISMEIMREALEKAKAARFFLLDKMEAAIEAPRQNLSQHAPRIYHHKVATDEIGTIIGPGGKMIREIQDTTGSIINIEEDGTVTIANIDAAGGEAALAKVKALVQKPEVGLIYKGTVKKIMNFGAFVEILPGKEGLLHISQIDRKRINKVEDVLKVGDEVEVKLLNVEPNGKLDLSRKVLLPEEE